jgi:acid phosphatase type 7
MASINSLSRALLLTSLALVSACAPTGAPRPVAAPRAEPVLFTIPDGALPRPLTFIAYGDMRFTAPTETNASRPAVRRALIARIAADKPAALFLSGDLPWHGGTLADYAVYRDETRAWRDAGVRVYPALGNHEFAWCAEAQCLENWWSTFPGLRGHRWYAVALGSQIRAIALDTDTSLLAGAPQRVWLEEQLAALPPAVRFVIIWLHHPPLANLATGTLADHNPRPNEIALADYLGSVAAGSTARFVVVAGHLHNYERFEQDGVVYLVSGGGGAHPYPVERSSRDLYQGPDFPNFHYVRFRLDGERLSAEMVRVADPDAGAPERFEVSDRFEVRAR